MSCWVLSLDNADEWYGNDVVLCSPGKLCTCQKETLCTHDEDGENVLLRCEICQIGT